jgi:hypothetical protein
MRFVILRRIREIIEQHDLHARACEHLNGHSLEMLEKLSDMELAEVFETFILSTQIYR